MNIQLVTSFSGEGYKKYAENMIKSFIKYWPTSVKLKAYYHDMPEGIELPSAVNVEYRNLHEIGEHEQFMAAWSKMEGKPEGWRWDAGKFTHKVFAIADAYFFDDAFDYLIWLDADTITNTPVITSVIEGWLTDEKPYDLIHLGREPVVNYSETSFIGFKKNPGIDSFVRDLLWIFSSGEFRNYMEWHDGYIFERILKVHLGHGMKVKNLSSPNLSDLNAFATSELGKYMTHFKGPRKEESAYPQGAISPQSNIQIKPMDCVDRGTMDKHIGENEKLIDTWIKMCDRHNGTMLIVSGGPDFKNRLQEFKDLMGELEESGQDVKVVCVKHAYNTLIENGIVPWACVMLDPRPFDGISTTGYKRTELVADPHPNTRFFVASMVDPKLTKHLVDKGAKVIGWDAYTNTIKDKVLPDGRYYLTGGTCAAMRAVTIGYNLGFRKFHLFGYDGCTWDTVDTKEVTEEGKPKWLAVKIGKAQRKFYTTGEWLAMAQDYGMLMSEINTGKADIDVKVHGDGILAELQKDLRVQRPHYTEVI